MMVFLSLSSQAGYSDWSEEEKNWFIASNAAIVFNWGTARDMSKRYGERYYAQNGTFIRAMEGNQPSTQAVDFFFVFRLATNYFITDYLTEYKKPYLIMTTFTHTANGINNVNIGLKINF